MTQSTIDALTRLERFGRLSETVALVGLLCMMMLLAVGQIVLREVFNSGIIWADELLKLTVLWLAMIATIAACRDNRHIRIDALSHLLPETLIRVTRVLVDLFAAAVCGVIALQTYRYLQLEIEFQDTVLIDTRAWIVHSIVPIAFALTGYRFVVGALKVAFGIDSVSDDVRVL